MTPGAPRAFSQLLRRRPLLAADLLTLHNRWARLRHEPRLEQRRCSILLATHSFDIVEHYADVAALLLDGRIVQQWNRAALDELRRAGGNALERALANEDFSCK